MTIDANNINLENESNVHDVVLVSAEFMAEVINALNVQDKEQINFLIDPLHSADVADIFEQLNENDRKLLASFIGSQMEPDVLSELDDSTLDDVIEGMDDKDVARAVTQMECDDAVHVLEDMDEEYQQKIIKFLSAEDRVAIEEGLSFPEDSAGRLLQRNLV